MNTTTSATPVQFKGLDPQKKYRIKEINLSPGTTSTITTDAVYSGEYLMTVGFNPDVNTRRTSVILQVDEAR